MLTKFKAETNFDNGKNCRAFFTIKYIGLFLTITQNVETKNIFNPFCQKKKNIFNPIIYRYNIHTIVNLDEYQFDKNNTFTYVSNFFTLLSNF
jgi:hypothetical protein